jgi:hypothetical protein
LATLRKSLRQAIFSDNQRQRQQLRPQLAVVSLALPALQTLNRRRAQVLGSLAMLPPTPNNKVSSRLELVYLVRSHKFQELTGDLQETQRSLQRPAPASLGNQPKIKLSSLNKQAQVYSANLQRQIHRATQEDFSANPKRSPLQVLVCCKLLEAPCHGIH